MRNFLPTLCLVSLLSLVCSDALGDELTTVDNYHAISESLVTAGQVKPEHIKSLRDAGFELVINLAPADVKYNEPEAFLVAGQGIAYVNIPVIWDNPTQQDLQLFFAIMKAAGERKTLVHCIANYRASAFTYLYRVLELDVDKEVAKSGLDVVWTDEAFEQLPIWRAFIETAQKGGRKSGKKDAKNSAQQ